MSAIPWKPEETEAEADMRGLSEGIEAAENWASYWRNVPALIRWIQSDDVSRYILGEASAHPSAEVRAAAAVRLKEMGPPRPGYVVHDPFKFGEPCAVCGRWLRRNGTYRECRHSGDCFGTTLEERYPSLRRPA